MQCNPFACVRAWMRLCLCVFFRLMLRLLVSLQPLQRMLGCVSVWLLVVGVFISVWWMFVHSQLHIVVSPVVFLVHSSCVRGVVIAFHVEQVHGCPRPFLGTCALVPLFMPVSGVR